MNRLAFVFVICGALLWGLTFPIAQQLPGNFPPGVFSNRAALSPVGVTFVGPGNVVASAAMWWGLRGYSAAYATGSNPAIDICDAAIGLTCTTGIKILANGSLDVATASAALACAVACVISKFYDQTGNGFDVIQATNSKRPTLTFNCLGSLPCATFVRASSQGLVTAGNWSQAQPFTGVGVWNRTGNTSVTNVLSGTSNPGFGSLVTNTSWMGDAANLSLTAANDNAWHAGQFVFNSTSSIQAVDGTSNTGDVGTTAAGGAPVGLGQDNSSAFMDGKITEGGWWPVAFSGANITAMCHNQFTYWGTATSC